MNDSAQILQDIYDSELNFCIFTFWDAGFDVRLGDFSNGYLAAWTVDSIDQAALFLKEQVLIHYPDSDFAKKYKEGEK